MKNFVKNLVIAFLMILAIYQTTELWFEEFSDHNFFSFISMGGTSAGQKQIYGIDRLIINLGDNIAVCRKENVTDTAYRAEFDKLITSAVNKGEPVSHQINWSSLFNNLCVIYDFGTPISTSDLCSVLGINKNRLADITGVDSIIILPNKTEDLVRLYVSDGSRTLCFDLKNADAAQNGINAISAFSADKNDFNYISSKGNGFNIFTSNTFIPSPDGEYGTLDVINPVKDGDMIDTHAVEDLVNGFFDNPAVKWSSVVDNAYVYSDENNVVKYSLNGVLEYSGYNAAETTGGEQSVLTNFSAAVEFMKKDSDISNDVVLSRIMPGEEKTVFYFDYAVNNASVSLSDELKAGLNMSSAIEVTVSKGRITRYRRYICRLEDSGTKQSIQTDFVNAADNVYSALDNTDSTVDSIDLAYKINGVQTNVPLSWRVEINGKVYWEAA